MKRFFAPTPPCSIDLGHGNAENIDVSKLSPDEVRSFLAEESIFRGACADAIEKLAVAAIQRSVPKGGSLFTMGQACEALHFVVEGTGLLVKIAPDGRERLLHRALPGEMVGAVPFFDGGDYPASFVAEFDCVVLSFPRDSLLAILKGDPRLPLSIIGALVDRLRTMVNLVERMSFEDTSHRLWNYLHETSLRSGAGEYPRVLDPLPTREKIALTIGTVREVVSRRLSHLARMGAIRIDDRRLTLVAEPC